MVLIVICFQALRCGRGGPAKGLHQAGNFLAEVVDGESKSSANIGWDLQGKYLIWNLW
jgi:hypothetical protein